MSLNFYQPHRHPSPEVEDTTDQDVTASVPAMPYHRSLAATQSVISSVSMAGDDLDIHWDMDVMDGGMSSPKMEFEPVSLCVISVHPLFNVLKVKYLCVCMRTCVCACVCACVCVCTRARVYINKFCRSTNL